MPSPKTSKSTNRSQDEAESIDLLLPWRSMAKWLAANLSPEALRSWIRSRPRDTQSFLMSLCVHLMLFILLALLVVQLPEGPKTLWLLPWQGGADGETVSLELGGIESHEQADAEDPATQSLRDDFKAADWNESASIRNEQKPTEKELTSVSEILQRLAQSDSSTQSDQSAASVSSLSHGFRTGSLQGRTPAGRRELALRNGGTQESEQAVEEALKWLKAHQLSDGSWSTSMEDGPCRGRCTQSTNEPGQAKKVAATGLAVLAFLGAGYTHRKGEYQSEVSKGIGFLVRTLHQRSPNGAPPQRGRFLPDGAPYEMYEQGIAALALCEARAMTRDSALAAPCEDVLRFIEEAQAYDGSWGYHPRESGDLSIVGWQAMALKSGASFGYPVKKDRLERMDRFLDSQSSEYNAYYGYRSRRKEPGTTSIGLLLRMYRGWSPDDPGIARGADYLVDLGPSIDGIYYNYYATQVLFHSKHERWPEWNAQVRDYLVKEQAKEGHERGSWSFGRNTFNRIGGRLYCTTLAALTLEVYYRYSPIYDELRDDDFAL